MKEIARIEKCKLIEVETFWMNSKYASGCCLKLNLMEVGVYTSIFATKMQYITMRSKT